MTNDRMQAAVRQKLDSELSALRTSPIQRESLYATATGGIKVKKKLTVGLVFALILFLTTLTALAMELSGWGLTDWLARKAADQQVPTTIPATHGDTDHRVATLQLRELTTDGYGVYTALAITPKEEGTLILNSQVSPYRTPAAQIGLAADTPEQTVAEWAAAHDYHKLYQIHLYGDTASAYNPMRIESDGTSLIMLSGEYKGDGYVYKLRYKISTFPDEETYWELIHHGDNCTIAEEADSIERKVLFTVAPPKNNQVELLAEYLPDPAHEQPKEYPQVTGVRVFRTPLAAYYDVSYIHPAAEDRMKDTIGEPSFFELQFFDREVYMDGWYIETLPNGSAQYHEISSCELPDPLPEQLSLECCVYLPEVDLEELIGIVYNHVPLIRK